MQPVGGRELPMALLLLRASRWFDAALLSALEEQGWPRVSPAQSLVFAHLDPGGTAPAELARRLGHTRQATQDLVAGLCRLDVLVVEPHPQLRRGRLVRLTERGRQMTVAADRILRDLEAGLGQEQMDALRALLLDVQRAQAGSDAACGLPGRHTAGEAVG